jgi:magnesium transporter
MQEDWISLGVDERQKQFMAMDRELAEDLFLSLPAIYQAEIIGFLAYGKRRSWIRMLPLDETADLIQQLPEELKESSLSLLDEDTRREVLGLLAYAEDDAGGLMTPHFIRLRPDMEVEVAIRYLRTYSKHQEKTISHTYVVDSNQVLLGVVSFRELLLSPPSKKIQDIMKTDLISVLDTLDQEEVAQVFKTHQLSAIPVVNEQGQLKGVVTYDDIASAIEEEATEDIQKIGGMEALDLPYWKTSIRTMLQKRAGWLMILFLGEMFTASAMAHYEAAIERAVVLALFIPLIISSGGNSGSQASTLIIRALALQEIKLQHWWKVLLREISSGLILGLVLGSIGVLRILLWPNKETIYGPHYGLIAMTVGCSLVGVVLWGATAGSMLPFILRKLKLDPASASAPFVATLVDVTGLVIYFNVASFLLKGTLM